MNDKDNLPVLENLCEKCKGTGERDDGGACYDCEGAGYVPTALGERILTLIEHQRQARKREKERRRRWQRYD